MLIACAATRRLQKPEGKDAVSRREAVCSGGSITLSYCPLLLCGPGPGGGRTDASISSKNFSREAPRGCRARADGAFHPALP